MYYAECLTPDLRKVRLSDSNPLSLKIKCARLMRMGGELLTFWSTVASSPGKIAA